MRAPLTEEEREFLSAPLTDNEAESASSPVSKEPQQLTAQQRRTLSQFHQAVAKQFSESLSEAVQQSVDVELVQVTDGTYSQFVHSRSQTTCMAVLNAHPLSHPMALDLGLDVFYTMLDMVLGGNGQHTFIQPTRVLTEMEKQIARRIVGFLIDELHDAWEHVLAVNLSIDRIESQASRARIIPPFEAVVSLVFDVKVANIMGPLTICVPLRSLRKVIDRVADEAISSTSTLPKEVNVEVKIVAGTVAMTPEQLSELAEGDVLISDTPANSLVSLLVDDEPRFKVQLGAIDDHKAVILRSRM